MTPLHYQMMAVGLLIGLLIGSLITAALIWTSGALKMKIYHLPFHPITLACVGVVAWVRIIEGIPKGDFEAFVHWDVATICTIGILAWLVIRARRPRSPIAASERTSPHSPVES